MRDRGRSADLKGTFALIRNGEACFFCRAPASLGSGPDYSTFSVTFGRPLTSSNDETFARSEPSTCKKIAAPARERENFFERRRHLGGTRLCPPD